MKFILENERMTALNDKGILMGHIVFPRIRTGLVNIRQITVYPAFRGQGVEDALMKSLLSHLDAHGMKAALTCPFAQAYVQQNPQWNHVLPGKLHFTSH